MRATPKKLDLHEAAAKEGQKEAAAEGQAAMRQSVPSSESVNIFDSTHFEIMPAPSFLQFEKVEIDMPIMILHRRRV